MNIRLNSAMKPGFLPLCVPVLICCLDVHAAEVDVSKLPPPATNRIDFTRDIRPILETSCLRCHGPENQKSHFRLDNRPSALKGGDQGVDILPGNSAKSPLIHFTARLVEDSEMPPLGKGTPLTPVQVSLLRAWIDQGAVWDTASQSNHLEFSFSPTLGDTYVRGDKQKFREHYWQKDGLNGGVEQFELLDQTGPDTRWLLDGHALLDDYKINLAVDRNDIGFVHSGWEQYRKYFDDTGGYAPLLTPAAPSLGRDLHLDIGKAWIDFGLTLPDWPRLVLGYEYDYKQGDEATTSWNAVGPQGTGRNIGPADKHLDEGTHIIKLDLDAEVKGVSIEERFRGEFYKLKTGTTNVAFGPLPESIAEGTTYFQGANTIRLEKKFTDWFFGSGGYLYSKLDADSAFRMDAPGLNQLVNVPEIELEKESHVGNLNGLFGPFHGLTLSTGVQAEWTRQHDLGAGLYDQQSPPPPPITDTLTPFTVSSDYDETSLQENAALRYSQIPFTTLFAEGRLEQQNIRQYDQLAAAHNILNKAVFLQHTDFASELDDLRVGFSTSPWRQAAFSAHYRRSEDRSNYDSDPLVQPAQTGYPTFIHSRDLLTDEAEAKLVLHPASRFSTTLSYQYRTTENDVDTASFIQFGQIISPGGELVAGREYSHVFAINATYTPIARLFLSAMFSYTASSLTTVAADSPVVVPYHGDVYTGLADVTYVLSETTDLFAAYSISEAEYGQNNYASGQPLGIQYQQQSGSIGLTRRFSKHVSAKLQYRFALYNEPSSGGANNYQAHSIFGTLMCQF
ncbi:MAG TPA: c-type cytochrome domain-containing protein [Candidatus Acidoferrales bacterium]|nr:c-type cytochrome domain-containing protein [Candidatus Acidoferrales bacterium]